MSTLPRVRQVAPIAVVKKASISVAIPSREKKPIDKTDQQNWKEALQTRSEVLSDALVVPIVFERQQQGSGGSEQGEQEEEQELKIAAVLPVRMTEQVANAVAAQAAEELLPSNLHLLGGLIAAFVVHSVVHGSWAVQISLSHDLLQETVLHMRCEQAILTLRFETSDWHSRETLMRHAPVLIRRLRESLPQLLDVMLLTE